jgi:hypothetical protein
MQPSFRLPLRLLLRALLAKLWAAHQARRSAALERIIRKGLSHID